VCVWCEYEYEYGNLNIMVGENYIHLPSNSKLVDLKLARSGWGQKLELQCSTV
jgi:hypothetical protein